MPKPDIFLWANQIEEAKDEILLDLFVVDHDDQVYRINYETDLREQVMQQFVFNMLSEIRRGAELGLQVREFDATDKEELIVMYLPVTDVPKSIDLLQNLTIPPDDIPLYNSNEVDFASIKTIVGRIKTPKGKESYILKTIYQSHVLKGKKSWAVEGTRFQRFEETAALNVGSDSQVLIFEGNIMVFDTKKFERIFDYQQHKNLQAEIVLSDIEKNFKFELPEGVKLSDLLKGRRRLITKLQKSNPSMATEALLIETAEDFEVELEFASGSIKINNSSDLETFVDLLNDNFIQSQMTGIKYVVASKRSIKKDTK